MLKKLAQKLTQLMILFLWIPFFMASFASSTTYETSFQTHEFKDSTAYIPNPFMGPVGFAKNRISNYEGTIVVGGITWAEIERNKGQYDFTIAEMKNNYHFWVNEKNRQMMLGFVMDYPTPSNAIDYSHIDIPMWLYEELKKEAEADYNQRLDRARQEGNWAAVRAYEEALYRIRNDDQVMREFNRTFARTADIPGVGTFYRFGSGAGMQVGFSPNYHSPLILKYHDNVLAAVARRYDNDKTFCIVMGSLGHWGEMHTFFIQGPNYAGRYPGKAIASHYEQAYAKYFHNTLVSSRQPREVARDHDFGLHNHAFGHPQHTYDWFIDWFMNGYTCSYTGDSHPAMPDFWKRAPSGAEFLSTGDNKYLSNWHIDGTIQQAEDSYLTWILETWVPLHTETRTNMERLLSKIGYRFAITEAGFNKSVAAGENIALTTTWRNSGTAPFYHDWPIMVQLKNEQGKVVSGAIINPSVRSLFPGTSETYNTSIRTSSNLLPGQYDLYVGINNPGTGQPAISLAVEGLPNQGKLYHIGSIEVREAENDTEDKRLPALYLQSDAGYLSAWQMEGTELLYTQPLTPKWVDPAWQAKAVIDMDGDGNADIVWQHEDGSLAVWYMDGLEKIRSEPILRVDGQKGIADPNWQIMAVYDLNNSGSPDIIWQYIGERFDGELAIWLMDGLRADRTGRLFRSPGEPHVSPQWEIGAIFDLLGDGQPEVIWQSVSGKEFDQLAYWQLCVEGDSFTRSASGRLIQDGDNSNIRSEWRMRTAFDLLGDGKYEIIFQGLSGEFDGRISYWEMDGFYRVDHGYLSHGNGERLIAPGWKIIGYSD